MKTAAILSRRDFGRMALALSGAGVLGRGRVAAAVGSQLSTPDSVWRGVTVGINAPYSFGSEATDAESVLQALRQIGLSSVELRADMAELYAGGPAGVGRRGGGGRGRGQQPTAEELAARQAAAEEAVDWRTSVSMDKFAELRTMYEDAGVRIDAFRMTLTAGMSDAEYDYVFNVTKALGASHVTMEHPENPGLTERIGAFASKHQTMVGYHMHTNASLTAWDVALAQSRFNAAQVDVGHYVAGTGESPIPLLEKHPTQIASLHLKDRKMPANGSANMSWGQGDTPIVEILQFMSRGRATYPAFIELEHMGQLPQGSSRMLEIYKCVEYCRNALM